jgi:hypothetical protein
MIFIRQGFTIRSRKAYECMIHMIAEARPTAGKSKLETALFIQPTQVPEVDPAGLRSGRLQDSP